MRKKHDKQCKNEKIAVRKVHVAVLMMLIAFATTLSLTGCAGGMNEGEKATEAVAGALFTGEEKVSDTMDNIIRDQEKADADIEAALADEKNTFRDPLIIENPYRIAPQTAIAVFSTKEETSIGLTVNGKEQVTFEKSKSHAIPIYGLYDDYDNEVVLTNDKGETSRFDVTMPKYKGAVLDVEKSDPGLSDEFYLVSPDYENTSIYDKDGKLLWYLDTGDNEGAVVFLDNGNFLISDPYQGTGGIRINYSGFMEMDYLGKIHKQYVGEWGYHHEIEPINDGRQFLISGNKDDSPFLQAVVYIVDAETMEVEKSIDLYDIFRKMAPEWVKSLGDPFNMVINGINYDEATGDVLISIRATGMVVRVNMDSGEVKWIFADPADMPEEFQELLLKPTDGTRYPYGQHAAMFIDEEMVPGPKSGGQNTAGTLIAYHNNDINIIKDEDQHLSNFLDRYSSNEIIEVDEKARTVSTRWTYDGGKKIFSKMSGSLEFRDDGHKLLSYGSAVRPEAYKHPETAEITDNQYTNGLMLELDEEDRVLWRATFPGVMHKVYRSTFYRGGMSGTSGAEFPNYRIEKYRLIDGQDQEKHAGTVVDISEYEKELKDAEHIPATADASCPITGFGVFINRAVVEGDFAEDDEVEILFVESRQGTARLFTYKEKGKMPRIINSGRYGVQITGLSGRNKAYISVNGKWYDTERIYDFGYPTE